MDAIFSRLLLMLCCLLAINTAQAAAEPADQRFIKPYRAVYDANFDFFLPVKGKAIRKLSQQENGNWLLSHRVEATLLTLKETSLFAWQNQQPKTLEYRYKQKSIGKSRDVQLEFDWDTQQVHHKTDKPAGSFKIAGGTLDKLTYQLKIRQDLLAGEKLPVYSVADKNRLKEYNFEIIGSVELKTPMGKLDTLKIKRNRGPDAKRETTLWLAKDWDYLLVKLHQKEKGKDYQVIMVEGELDGQPVKGL